MVSALKTLYKTYATATGKGRNGHVEVEEGSLVFDLAIPKSMGGSGDGPNPEQLFAAGYSACFLSALKFAATMGLHDTSQASVKAIVAIGPALKGGFALGVELDVTLPGLNDDTAIALVKRGHKYCPYSNATRNNIDVKLTVNGILVSA